MSRETSSGAVLVAVLLLFSCDLEGRKGQQLGVQEGWLRPGAPSAKNVSSKVRVDGVLVAATRNRFPLTNQQVDIGKYPSAPTWKINARDYTLKGARVDHLALQKAERAKYRKLYGLWSPKGS